MPIYNELESNYYQPLFDLMTEHNLFLLESEMDEIIAVVNKMHNDIQAP